MQNFNNIVIVFPVDQSIDFLIPIQQTLIELFPNAILFRPSPGTHGDVITDDTDLVIFLGHGTSSQLFGSLNDDGSKTSFLNVQSGALILQELTSILFSCNSADYIKKVKASASIESYLTFGDMPTDWDHINYNRDLDATYLQDFQDKHLEFFKSSLVEIMIDGFRYGFESNSFISLVKRINVSVKKKINQVILSEDWSVDQKKQMIQLLVNFNTEMRYAKPI